MKRIFFLTMLFAILFSMTSLGADETMDVEKEENEEVTIQPRYTYLGFVSISLNIDGNGFTEYNCSAGAPDYNVRMKLYLQRSRNQFLWEDIIGTIKTVSQSGRISESYNLPANDYFYRAKVVVEVLDDNKNIIESETAYSSTERY